jgi:hypothetical protein
MKNKFTLALYLFIATNSLMTFINKLGEPEPSTLQLYASGIAFALSFIVIILILRKYWLSKRLNVEQ